MSIGLRFQQRSSPAKEFVALGLPGVCLDPGILKPCNLIQSIQHVKRTNPQLCFDHLICFGPFWCIFGIWLWSEGSRKRSREAVAPSIWECTPPTTHFSKIKHRYQWMISAIRKWPERVTHQETVALPLSLPISTTLTTLVECQADDSMLIHWY